MNKEELINKCVPYTMTNPKRLGVIYDCVELISIMELDGAFVEAGVYKGGSSMMIAYTAKAKELNNPLYMLDTYEGMPKPEKIDVKVEKQNDYTYKWEQAKRDGYVDWCYASYEEVEKNMDKVDYEDVTMIKGMVEQTIPDKRINKISLLRIDTDFYSSTKHLLENLYDKVENGGFIIFDDYYCWEGAKKAVDEFFEERNLNIGELDQIDHSCALYQKGLS